MRVCMVALRTPRGQEELAETIILNTSGSYWYFFNSTPGSFFEGDRRTDLQM